MQKNSSFSAASFSFYFPPPGYSKDSQVGGDGTVALRTLRWACEKWPEHPLQDGLPLKCEEFPNVGHSNTIRYKEVILRVAAFFGLKKKDGKAVFVPQAHPKKVWINGEREIVVGEVPVSVNTTQEKLLGDGSWQLPAGKNQWYKQYADNYVPTEEKPRLPRTYNNHFGEKTESDPGTQWIDTIDTDNKFTRKRRDVDDETRAATLKAIEDAAKDFEELPAGATPGCEACLATETGKNRRRTTNRTTLRSTSSRRSLKRRKTTTRSSSLSVSTPDQCTRCSFRMICKQTFSGLQVFYFRGPSVPFGRV